MKEPKTWKYPRLYWSDPLTLEKPYFAEFIIVYPSGKAERSPLPSYFGNDQICLAKWVAPCWHHRDDFKFLPEEERANETVHHMKHFAARHGFKRIFVGEIK